MRNNNEFNLVGDYSKSFGVMILTKTKQVYTTVKTNLIRAIQAKSLRHLRFFEIRILRSKIKSNTVFLLKNVIFYLVLERVWFFKSHKGPFLSCENIAWSNRQSAFHFVKASHNVIFGEFPLFQVRTSSGCDLIRRHSWYYQNLLMK